MIFVIMGKSATGKDTIYSRLMQDETLGLKMLVSYTTRPCRSGEMEGREYHFVDESRMQSLQAAGKVVEHRQYETVHGIWHYFTVDDNADLRSSDVKYAVIVTLEAYVMLRKYYGDEYVIPIYITVDDFERLNRAVTREKQQAEPSCEEVCRRYIADEHDFSVEKLAKAGITTSFINEDVDNCVREIKDYIKNYRM